MYDFLIVFTDISGFVSSFWARVLFATRYYQSATVECRGTTRKIHVPENSVNQGVAHACYHDGFEDLGTFDEAPGTLSGPRGPR